MKKLALIAATTAVLSTSAFAEENMFYLRGDVGANFVQKITVLGAKMKSKACTSLSLGVGYYVMDNVRAELEYTHLFNPETKGSLNGLGIKAKSKVDALMARGYVDVAEFGVAKLFVTAGVGLSQVSSKCNWSYVVTPAVPAVVGPPAVPAVPAVIGTNAIKLKKKNNFAWSLGVGSGFDVADSVKLDVQYNFTDFGSGKTPAGYTGKARVRAHVIKAGVRFEI